MKAGRGGEGGAPRAIYRQRRKLSEGKRPKRGIKFHRVLEAGTAPRSRHRSRGHVTKRKRSRNEK